MVEDAKNINHVRRINDGDISKFKRLNPTWFSNDDSKNSCLVPGFQAEEIAAVYPSVAVYEDDNAIDWSEKNLIPFMVKAIQKCQRQINELEKEVKRLRG